MYPFRIKCSLQNKSQRLTHMLQDMLHILAFSNAWTHTHKIRYFSSLLLLPKECGFNLLNPLEGHVSSDKNASINGSSCNHFATILRSSPTHAHSPNFNFLRVSNEVQFGLSNIKFFNNSLSMSSFVNSLLLHNCSNNSSFKYFLGSGSLNIKSIIYFIYLGMRKISHI